MPKSTPPNPPPVIRYHSAPNVATSAEQGFGWRTRVIAPDEATTRRIEQMLEKEFNAKPY